MRQQPGIGAGRDAFDAEDGLPPWYQQLNVAAGLRAYAGIGDDRVAQAIRGRAAEHREAAGIGDRLSAGILRWEQRSDRLAAAQIAAEPWARERAGLLSAAGRQFFEIDLTYENALLLTRQCQEKLQGVSARTCEAEQFVQPGNEVLIVGLHHLAAAGERCPVRRKLVGGIEIELGEAGIIRPRRTDARQHPDAGAARGVRRAEHVAHAEQRAIVALIEIPAGLHVQQSGADDGHGLIDDIAAGPDQRDVADVVGDRIIEEHVRRRAGADDIAPGDDLKRLGGNVPLVVRRKESGAHIGTLVLNLPNGQVVDVDAGVNQRRLVVARVQVVLRRVRPEGDRIEIGVAEIGRTCAGVARARVVQNRREDRLERCGETAHARARHRDDLARTIDRTVREQFELAHRRRRKFDHRLRCGQGRALIEANIAVGRRNRERAGIEADHGVLGAIAISGERRHVATGRIQRDRGGRCPQGEAGSSAAADKRGAAIRIEPRVGNAVLIHCGGHARIAGATEHQIAARGQTHAAVARRHRRPRGTERVLERAKGRRARIERCRHRAAARRGQRADRPGADGDIAAQVGDRAIVVGRLAVDRQRIESAADFQNEIAAAGLHQGAVGKNTSG